MSGPTVAIELPVDDVFETCVALASAVNRARRNAKERPASKELWMTEADYLTGIRASVIDQLNTQRGANPVLAAYVTEMNSMFLAVAGEDSQP